MQHEVIVAGFGGQGVLLAGILLAEAALQDGKEVTWVPAYGPEMRGGTCNCTVIVSDELIASPVASEVSFLIGMNEPSLQKFGPIVRTGGTIYHDSSSGDTLLDRDDVDIVAVPAAQIAAEIGSPKVVNMVMLGALVGSSGLTTRDTLVSVMEKQLVGEKARFVPLNIQALDAGIEIARQHAKKSGK
jgi:2-oxoglutarate ferredoxin oxidoreductase subunit gamma